MVIAPVTKNSNQHDKKKRLPVGSWDEARALMWRYRYRLTLGLAMMLVSNLAALVLPAMSRYIIDVVVPEGSLALALRRLLFSQ